jgi:hypothetical protein
MRTTSGTPSTRRFGWGGVGDDEEDLLVGQEDFFSRSAPAQIWEICVYLFSLVLMYCIYSIYHSVVKKLCLNEKFEVFFLFWDI